MPSITITHDGSFSLAESQEIESKKWKNNPWTWSAFLNRLQTTVVTRETLREFLSFSKKAQGRIKDIGSYMGGTLNGPQRLLKNLSNRQVLTLDADSASTGFWDDFTLFYDNAAALHSTHKHSPKSPRYRLVMPLSRPVYRNEYEALIRKMAELLGMKNFCPSSFQPHQAMFWPSSPTDVPYMFEYQDGPWLNPDTILRQYVDWRNMTAWPEHPDEIKIRKSDIAEQQDPLTKDGPVGAFCKEYTIHDAIEKFLNDVYEKCGAEDRYTYRGGSTYAGVITYDDKFSYSHHGTDPASHKTCNAFDLVRIHKFGDKDQWVHDHTPLGKYPSQVAMLDFVRKDKAVVARQMREQAEMAQLEFGENHVAGNGIMGENDGADSTDNTDERETPVILAENSKWLEDMDVDRQLQPLTTIKNIRLILENDVRLKRKIAFNEMSQKTVVLAAMPWDRKFAGTRSWTDTDWGCLRCLLGEAPYNLGNVKKVEDVMHLIRINNSFHPVQRYLKELVWDGTQRIDTVFQDYLGARNSNYLCAVTRKTLTAAVARIFTPGIKFDHILTLVGPQGVGKSTIIKKLGRSWYSDTFNFNMLRNNQAYEQLGGYWIIETGEMAGLKKAEVEAIKNFISSGKDTYRPAYGHETVEQKRQCIFIGSTNNFDFLRKSNGNRRFWPVDLHVEIPKYDLFTDFTDAIVDQVWAEAYLSWKRGESLNLSADVEEEAFAIQKQHEEVDEQRHLIEAFLDVKLPKGWSKLGIAERLSWLSQDDVEDAGTEYRDRISAVEVWVECLKKPRAEINSVNSKPIYEILRELKDWQFMVGKSRVPGYGILYCFQRLKMPIEEL